MVILQVSVLKSNYNISVLSNLYKINGDDGGRNYFLGDTWEESASNGVQGITGPVIPKCAQS